MRHNDAWHRDSFSINLPEWFNLFNSAPLPSKLSRPGGTLAFTLPTGRQARRDLHPLEYATLRWARQYCKPDPTAFFYSRAFSYRPKIKNMLKISMRKDSLMNTNSYLRDLKRREALLAKTVVSSTAIEGVHLDWNELEKSLSISNRNIRLHVSAKSSESRR